MPEDRIEMLPNLPEPNSQLRRDIYEGIDRINCAMLGSATGMTVSQAYRIYCKLMKAEKNLRDAHQMLDYIL